MRSQELCVVNKNYMDILGGGWHRFKSDPGIVKSCHLELSRMVRFRISTKKQTTWRHTLPFLHPRVLRHVCDGRRRLRFSKFCAVVHFKVVIAKEEYISVEFDCNTFSSGEFEAVFVPMIFLEQRDLTAAVFKEECGMSVKLKVCRICRLSLSIVFKISQCTFTFTRPSLITIIIMPDSAILTVHNPHMHNTCTVIVCLWKIQALISSLCLGMLYVD